MSLTSWRQFQFYESTPIRDPHLGTDTPLYSDPTLSAAAVLGKNRLVIAIKSTVIRLIDISAAKIEHEFDAFEDGYQITYLEVIQGTFLVAVGEYTGKASLIKIYSLKKLPSNARSFHSIVEVKNGNNTYPISVISISQDLTCIAIGFVNGKILLIRGDLSRDRGSRQRIIYEDPGREPVTSLFFNQDATVCFAATTSKILLFNTTGRNSGQPDLILNSQQGVDLNCSCFSPFMNEYVCSLKDHIDFYKATGEKLSIAIDLSSVKRIYPIDKDHLLLVVQAEYTQSTVLDVEEHSQSNANRVLILDTKNKLISLNLFISSAIIDIFLMQGTEDTSVCLLTSEVVIYKITEKSLQEQISILIQKELFTFALELANQNSLDHMQIQDIHRQYGDWLYKKGLKSEAVEEYIQCLDVVETSEIISKFGIAETPDPKGLKNLSDYLWSIIKHGVSNSDHVTLLLIALVKLRAEDEIKHFIDHYSRSGKYATSVITDDLDDETYFYSDKTLFDLTLVLQLLQESGFSMLAYQLASKFAKDPVVIVEILLTSLNDPHCALKYIKSLSIDETLRALVAFSKQLLEKLPNDTNILLIDVFTGKFKQTAYETTLKEPETSSHELSDDIKTVFYSYRTFLGYMNSQIGNSKAGEDDSTNGIKPTYHPPKPSLIFSSFLSKPFEFVVFLEACLESYQRYEGYKEDKQVILTTLYDLYLSLALDDVPERQADWRLRASTVLAESNKLVSGSDDETSRTSLSGKPIDNSLMMLISHMNKIDIYSVDNDSKNEPKDSHSGGKKASLLNTLRSLIFMDDSYKCLKFLEKYGEQEPYLYRVALTYFISSRHALKEIGGESVLKEQVLNKIIDQNLMSILDILQVLASTNVVTYGLVQDMLINHVQQEEDQITRSRQLIASYQSELETKKERLQKLLSSEEPSQIKIKNLKCFMCQTALELPVVYFKCDHIYHQRCLNEEENLEAGRKKLFKCPKCMVEMETSEKLYQAQEEVSSKVELLQMALNSEQDSNNRFRVVTEFIGRGGLEYSHVTLEQ